VITHPKTVGHCKGRIRRSWVYSFIKPRLKPSILTSLRGTATATLPRLFDCHDLTGLAMTRRDGGFAVTVATVAIHIWRSTNTHPGNARQRFQKKSIVVDRIPLLIKEPSLSA
jgi:hypothetical protein